MGKKSEKASKQMVVLFFFLLLSVRKPLELAVALLWVVCADDAPSLFPVWRGNTRKSNQQRVTSAPMPLLHLYLPCFKDFGSISHVTQLMGHPRDRIDGDEGCEIENR